MNSAFPKNTGLSFKPGQPGLNAVETVTELDLFHGGNNEQDRKGHAEQQNHSGYYNHALHYGAAANILQGVS